MCSPLFFGLANRTFSEWPVSDGFGASQEAQNVGSVARPLAMAAFISALPELRSITGERSSAMTVPVGEPSTASAAATAAATRHFERVEKVEFIVDLSRTEF